MELYWIARRFTWWRRLTELLKQGFAGGGVIVADGLQKIIEDGLVAAEIADGGGGGALVFVIVGFNETGGGGGFGGGGWGVSEIGFDDAVVLENDSAFGA